MVRSKIDVLAYLPGYRREYDTKNGKKTNQRFVSPDGQVTLSVRQAQDVAHGRKTLTQATLTSFKGKEVHNPKWKPKRPIKAYEFKDLFDARDFILNNPTGQDTKIFITVHGVPYQVYPDEEKTKNGVWRAPLSPSNPSTWRTDKYWERIIDRSGDWFEGDPDMYSVTYLL